MERIDAPSIVFLTVCVARRRWLLANEPAAGMICHAWRMATAWRVGRYVIMPDHIHLFCSPTGSHSLQRWVQFWKAMTTRTWHHPRQLPIWQRDSWDTQMRSFDSYEAKWEYVRSNPVRHGLASNPDEWPFQGEIARLEWV